jgi:hypothetical protein
VAVAVAATAALSVVVLARSFGRGHPGTATALAPLMNSILSRLGQLDSCMKVPSAEPLESVSPVAGNVPAD